MMKKMHLLAALFALVLTGCNDKKAEEAKTETTETAAPQATEPASSDANPDAVAEKKEAESLSDALAKAEEATKSAE